LLSIRLAKNRTNRNKFILKLNYTFNILFAGLWLASFVKPVLKVWPKAIKSWKKKWGWDNLTKFFFKALKTFFTPNLNFDNQKTQNILKCYLKVQFTVGSQKLYSAGLPSMTDIFVFVCIERFCTFQIHKKQTILISRNTVTVTPYCRSSMLSKRRVHVIVHTENSTNHVLRKMS
jgi:hypothetical protein